jgi:hypothetical protein
MSWFDDLLNTQWWKDGIALPRRQIVNVTFNPAGNGDIIDDGPVLDRHRLRMPFYRPYWHWPMTAAPAVAALRYVRPFRDTYDTTTIVNEALVVPHTFCPTHFSFICMGSTLVDSAVFVAYKNGVATALSLTIPGGTFPGTFVDVSNGTGVTWNRGDRLGLGVTQGGAFAQVAWNALVVLQ